MGKWLYWLKKTFRGNIKYCSGFCVTCRHYEVCKKDQVLE